MLTRKIPSARALSRRRLLSTASLASIQLPGWMPRLAFREDAQDRQGDVLVCLFQRGGMDGLSAVVPYEERRYYDSRPKIAFKPPQSGNHQAVKRLDDRFGLAPGLSGLGRIWDEGRLSIVHAVGSPHGSRSHFEAMGFVERGTPGDKSLNTGWLGRHISATAAEGDSPFRAIGFGTSVPQSLRGPIPAASLRSIADFHLKGREDELSRFKAELEALWCADDWLSEDTRGTFEALELLEAADPLQYTPENGASYPQSDLGQGLKQIAQLIKADIGLEIACIDIGGWDTHINQVWPNHSDVTKGRMHSLFTRLDAAIYAFYQDLGRRFDDPGITLVTMSEFGRRVAQNSGNGTDHGEATCMFIVSGAAEPGVHTDWPGLEPENLARGEDLAIAVDYRDVLGELLLGRMGNGRLHAVFPDHEFDFWKVVRHRADAPGIAPKPEPVFLPNLRA